jgi:hypothetical protein
MSKQNTAPNQGDDVAANHIPCPTEPKIVPIGFEAEVGKCVGVCVINPAWSLTQRRRPLPGALAGHGWASVWRSRDEVGTPHAVQRPASGPQAASHLRRVRQSTRRSQARNERESVMETTPAATSLAVLEIAQAGQFAQIREKFALQLRPMVTAEAMQAAWRPSSAGAARSPRSACR